MTFSEYARAVDGMPHAPGIGKDRVAPPISAGPPRGPTGPRVSATRHGVTGINCRPLRSASVTTVASGAVLLIEFTFRLWEATANLDVLVIASDAIMVTVSGALSSRSSSTIRDSTVSVWDRSGHLQRLTESWGRSWTPATSRPESSWSRRAAYSALTQFRRNSILFANC